MSQSAHSPYAPPVSEGQAPRSYPPPSAFLAALLSFFAPGLGQVYAGRTVRGIVWNVAPMAMLLIMALSVRVASGRTFLVALALVFVIPWIAAITDAAVVAVPSRARAPVPFTIALGLAFFLSGRAGAFTLRAFVVQAFKIPSGSMAPAIMVGDHIFVDKTSTHPQLGEIIVFPFPENPKQDFVKRVIGLPGDKVEFRNGALLLNDVPIPRCLVGNWRYDVEDPPETHRGALYLERLGARAYLAFYEADNGLSEGVQGPWTVPAGQVWVAGDNRNNAHDSRFWAGGKGAGVPIDTVRGTGIAVWLPLSANGIDWPRMGAPLDEPVLPGSAASLGPALAKCQSTLGRL